VAGQLVDQQLGHVLDHRVAARGVAVEGGVANRGLALVPGGEHEPAAVLVRERHQQQATDAGLEVLLGQVLAQALEAWAEHVEQRGVRGLDGDLAVVDPEVGRQLRRV
jgi:hypothetical protein